jgi:pyruvate dehydrogenase E2 component (dihydrolipoamide acetyltransferase)
MPADVIPLTGIRRTIAERMQASKQTAPHISLSVDAEMTALESWLVEFNQDADEQGAEKISLTAALLFLIGRALRNHPYLNASIIDDQIYLWKDVNIGVATAVEEGLIVPVIKNADQLTVTEINSRVKQLTTAARSGRLGLSDVQGGTFTLSNLGMFGIHSFQAIINPPESAILAVGKIIDRPVVGNDRQTVSIQPMMNLTLSADHRIVDGVVAATFLADLVTSIESPFKSDP